MRKYSTITAVLAVALCALGAGPAIADAPPMDTAHDTGVWQKHQYSFAFLGFTTTYSCDGLADKLKLLLIASGARADAKARSGACASGFGRPDKFARADLTFYTLAPAGAATAGTSAATDSVAAGAPVAAIWRPVALAARRPRELGTGDCELVEQFRSNVLPLFTTRNLENGTTCVPHQDSGSVINLKFESLSGMPRKLASPGATGTP